MLKVRFARKGRKGKAFYDLVVAEALSPRDGKHVEKLGHYDPHKKFPESLKINLKRIGYWIAKGAQPSEKVHAFLGKLDSEEYKNSKTAKDFHKKFGSKVI